MAEDIHWINYTQRFKTNPIRLTAPVNTKTGMIICIPALAEPNIVQTLASIKSCTPPTHPFEVIVLFNVNDRMSDKERNVHQHSIKETKEWLLKNINGHIPVHVLEYDVMPDARGGVGWARKLAMDEAALRLPQEGVILCLDADCEVETNYLVEVEAFFKQNPQLNAAGIDFQHDYAILSTFERNNIIHYELHLRYLRQSQLWCGHPYAFHTIGSSMAIRRKGYLAQGGMNTRMAGEDFYLLQKFIETDSFGEILTTTVFPSARHSGRVPFGTGRAMLQSSLDNYKWTTAHFKVFEEIRPLFHHLDKLFSLAVERKLDCDKMRSDLALSEKLLDYLSTIGFIHEVNKIHSQTSGYPSFRKRFFRYFNAFRMIKFMHTLRDLYYPDQPVTAACDHLFTHKNMPPGSPAIEDYLSRLRQLDNPKKKLNG